MRTLPVLILSVACGGLSETEFQVDVLSELCDAAATCEGTFSAEDCYDFVRATDRSKCDYDPDQARTCRDAIPEARCVDGGDLGTFTWKVPQACDTVWDCGPISLDTP